MKLNGFVVFILIITVGLMQIFNIFKHHFSGIDELKSKVVHLVGSIDKEKMKVLLADHQMQEMQQHVATLIPKADIKNNPFESQYQLRSLASTVQVPSEKLQELDLSKSLFESAKSAFRNKDFEKASLLFHDVILHYPNSIHILQSHFLLVESQFQQSDFESCVATIELMMDRYPESELTGFAMLRLGAILEKEDRLEDAKEVFENVFNQSQWCNSRAVT